MVTLLLFQIQGVKLLLSIWKDILSRTGVASESGLCNAVLTYSWQIVSIMALVLNGHD